MLQRLFFTNRMKFALIGMGLLLAISCNAQDRDDDEAEEDEQEEAQEAPEEGELQLAQLPVAVQKAAKAESQGATVHGFSAEEEDGKTMYEMETTVNGHSRDVVFDAMGNVVSVESEVSMQDVPDAARAALQAAIGKGTLDSVESVTEHGMVSYEATYTEGGKEMEVTVDPNGKRVP